MKANFFFFGLDRTGGTLVLLRYLDALRRAGHDASITTLGTATDARFVTPPEGVPTTYAGLRSKAYKAAVKATPARFVFPRLEVARLAGSAPAADVHVAGYSLTVDAALRAEGAVYAHVQHFEPLIVPRGAARRRALASYRYDLYRTANCTWVADMVEGAGGTVRGIVAPGVDLDVFTPSPEPPVDEGVLRVLTLGKAAAWKGLVDVVTAAREVAASRPVELVTYGPDKPPGPFGAARSVHHGFVPPPRLAELYRTSTMCVSASWYESFPLPPLEAMACGTPVICTRLGTEDYAVHEENCLLVPPKDPHALAAAITRLATDGDLRQELIAGGLRTAARFTWESAESAFVRHVEAAAGS